MSNDHTGNPRDDREYSEHEEDSIEHEIIFDDDIEFIAEDDTLGEAMGDENMTGEMEGGQHQQEEEEEEEVIENDSVAAFTDHTGLSVLHMPLNIVVVYWICKISHYMHLYIYIHARVDTDSVYCVNILERSEKGDILVATGSGDETAMLWKIEKPSSSSSSSSSSAATAGGGDGGVTIKKLQTLSGHTDTIVDISFSHDGQYIATGGMDGHIGVWSLDHDSGTCTQHKMLEGPGEAIEWVQWNPKAHFVLAGSADSTCWLFNAKSGKCANVFAGHSDSVTAGCFTSDGKYVLTGSEDATVRFWSPSTGNAQHVFSGNLFSEGPITCIVSKPDDAQIFASTSLDGLICIGHTGNGRVLHRFGVSNPNSDDNSVETADFCPTNTSMLATGSLDKRIVIWDLNTAQARQTFSHDDCVIKVLFDQHAPLLYSSSADRTVRVWDYRTGEAVRVFRGHREAVLDFAVTGDGSFIVSGSDDTASLVFSTRR